MKGYCGKCGNLIDETEIVHHVCKSYWIDGHFVVFWSGNSYYCHDRDLYVPKNQTIRLTEDRIYIDPSFARGQIIKRTKILRADDNADMHLIRFEKALNTPWKREYSEQQYKVSLP